MRYDVIVVGGGFAGLSAAAALAEAGRRVLVVEARRTLGGRATTFTDPRTGECVDNGQHVFFGCYQETFRFLRRIGTLDAVALQPALVAGMIDARGRRSTLRCPRLPSPFHLLAGIARWSGLTVRDRWSLLKRPSLFRDVQYGHTVRAAGRQGPTVREWLERRGQSRHLIEMFWEPLAVAALNQPITVAGADAFQSVLRSLLGSGTSGTSLGLARRPLDALYTHAARAFVEARGGLVRCGAPAKLVVQPAPPGMMPVASPPAPDDLIVTVGAEAFAAPCVISAVPWFAVDDLFANPPAALEPLLVGARQLASSPIVTVNLWLDRPLGGDVFVGLPGRRFQWVFDTRLLFGGSASHLSMVAGAADDLVGMPNEEVAARAVAELRGAVPEARDAAIRRSLVVRERRATFSVAPDAPARPDMKAPVRGLWLAGDWIETGLPATIEGAVLSGHRAAAAVCAQSPVP